MHVGTAAVRAPHQFMAGGGGTHVNACHSRQTKESDLGSPEANDPCVAALCTYSSGGCTTGVNEHLPNLHKKQHQRQVHASPDALTVSTHRTDNSVRSS